MTTLLIAGSGIAQAQSNDPIRMMQMEENVRQLNGQVEELRFQLLEMQENMRKMREDMEFRIQELEEGAELDQGSSDAPKLAEEQSLGKQLPSDTTDTEVSDGVRESIADIIGKIELEDPQTRRTIDGVEIFDPNKDVNADNLKPSGSLGTIIFDQNGNVIDNNVQGSPLKLGGNNEASAAQPSELPSNPENLFELGYQYFLAGDYKLSADAFQAYSDQFPSGAQISDANFWLGESLFSLRRYEDSARVFLGNHRQFPDARMAPQNLLKLGVSLAAMSQRELACATYAEVKKLYPNANRSIQNKVDIEQRSAKCQG